MLSIKRSALPVLGLLLALNGPAQTRVYVAAAATGANDGSGWADAFPDLQSALQIAQAGDTIWVAAGTYKPTADDRTISFVQPSDVRLYGGFAGTETALDQRDWEANPTVLSGDIGIGGDSTDNSYNVLYMPYPDSNTVLDGFVLRDGLADYGGPTTSTDRRKCGAGLYVMAEDGDAYPLIRNCRFERNAARLSGGGALVNATGDGSAAPYFFNCVFVDNAAQNGGGLARLGGSWVERPADLDSCVLLGNRANARGGGFYYSDSERSDRLDVSRCQFEKNTASVGGGGIFTFLGRENGAEFDVNSTLFKENKTEQGGAALMLFTSSPTYTKSLNIQNCRFIKNQFFGSGTSNDIVTVSLIGTENAITLLTNNYFTENIQAGGVGRVFSCNMEFCNFFAYNNAFIKNTSASLVSLSLLFVSTQNIHFDKNKFHENENVYNVMQFILQNPATPSTTAFQISNCSITNTNFIPDVGRYVNGGNVDSLVWTNCTIANNTAVSNHSKREYITIQNCSFSGIPANNGPGENSFWESSVNTYISHSHLGDLDCSDLPAPVTCGPGILTGIDPLFAAPDSGDYRLQPCSPLVNAGDNAGLDTQMTDLAGQPRIQSDIVDIGAYETAPPQLFAAPLITPSCPGGFSGAAAFQPEQGCAPYAYAWTSGAASGQNTNQLAPGDYIFTVTDARGSYFSVALSVPGDGPSFDLALSSAPVVCGDTLGGSAAVVAQNALPPLIYDWQTGVTDSLLAGLSAGVYAVTVTDAQGCTAVGTTEVTLSGGLSIAVEVTAISCPGAADGAFTVQPANGQAPFAWQWADGPTGPTHGPLGPGVYMGTLTDAFGCTIGWALPLDDPQAIAFDTAVTQASGPSAADGSAVVSGITGGQSPFGVVWSNGDTGFTADSLAPGLYGVTVMDANGCEQSLEFEISFASAVEAPLVESLIRVFPNPVSGWFTVRLTGYSDSQLSWIVVADALGRVMLTQTLDRADTVFDARAWPAGVYLLRVIRSDDCRPLGRTMRLVVGP